VSAETRLGLWLLTAALALGLLGDLLLRATPLGLNAPLWTIAIAAAFAVLARGRPSAAPLWVAAPLVLFAACFAWRDSVWLAWLDAGGVFAVLSVATLRHSPIRAWSASVSDYARAALEATAAMCFGILVTVTDEIAWRELARGEHRKRAVAVARGISIAVPLLIVFGGLFVAADAVFQNLLGDLAPDLGGFWSHLFLFLGCAWAAGGILRGLVVSSPYESSTEGESTTAARLGFTETTIVLATIDLLFLAFVLVQFRYFFGGNALVQERTGLTYAEYARHGFFELVAVAALAVGLILLADHFGRRDTARQQRIFRTLGMALVALLFVIVASALQRMRLYQREYGLTELRVYTTAFMLWLTVVLVWLLATVMRGRHARFAPGALVAGLASIVVLNAVNPDALIARTNVDRAEHGKGVDILYLSELSADAAPTLVRELPALARRDRGNREYRYVANELLERWRGDADWRTWSWGRSRARSAVHANEGELRRLATRG
jgi:hypothetical protein